MNSIRQLILILIFLGALATAEIMRVRDLSEAVRVAGEWKIVAERWEKIAKGFESEANRCLDRRQIKPKDRK